MLFPGVKKTVFIVHVALLPKNGDWKINQTTLFDNEMTLLTAGLVTIDLIGLIFGGFKINISRTATVFTCL